MGPPAVDGERIEARALIDSLPCGRILLVCDNFSSHFANLIDHVDESLDITRVALPAYSPHLNPIEPIWNCVKRDLSPRDVEDTEIFRDLIRSAYDDYAEQMSFVTQYTEQFLALIVCEVVSVTRAVRARKGYHEFREVVLMCLVYNIKRLVKP